MTTFAQRNLPKARVCPVGRRTPRYARHRQTPEARVWSPLTDEPGSRRSVKLCAGDAPSVLPSFTMYWAEISWWPRFQLVFERSEFPFILERLFCWADVQVGRFCFFLRVFQRCCCTVLGSRNAQGPSGSCFWGCNVPPPTDCCYDFLFITGLRQFYLLWSSCVYLFFLELGFN